MANAIYLALGHSLNVGALKERDISVTSVQGKLARFPSHAPIADALSTLCGDVHYKHIAALANKSKHQSLVRPVLIEDFTGTRAQRHELCF
jgi:hypothetical protein